MRSLLELTARILLCMALVAGVVACDWSGFVYAPTNEELESGVYPQ